MESFQASACACEDKSCATDVLDDYAKWLNSSDAFMAPDEAAAMGRLVAATTGMGNCLVKHGISKRQLEMVVATANKAK